MNTKAPNEEKELFTELYPSLRRFAAVVGDDDMEPEDLVQEALTSALARGSISGLDDPGAFLRTSIMNEIRSGRRRAARRAKKANLIAADLPPSHHDRHDFEVDGVLPVDPLDRAIVWLTAIEGRSSEEVAVVVELSAAAVRKRLSRVRSHYVREGLNND